MSGRVKKKAAKKNKEVAKVETINGLVCLYDKREAGVVEHEDNFVMNITLRDGQYAERNQIMFLFNQHAKRMCGIFEAVSVERDAELSYKIHVRVQKRCLPIEGPELAKLASDCGLKLQGSPEPLTAKQVHELVYSFRTLTDSRAQPPETRVYSTGFIDGGVEALYNDSYSQRAQPRYLPPQVAYPDYCPDNYDEGENHVPDGGYARATHRMNMKLPEQVPMTYAQMAPVAAVECSRSTNNGWKADVLVCPPEAYGAAYGHPATSQRSMPAPEGLVYERQARGPGPSYGVSPLDYVAEALPASRVPVVKNGNEISQSGPPTVERGQASHKKPEPTPPPVPKTKEKNPPVSKAKSAGKRVALEGQVNVPCSKSRQRQVAMQAGQNSKKVTVFDRLSINRQSVWLRIQQQPQQQRQEQLQPQEREKTRESDGSSERLVGKKRCRDVSREPAEASVSREEIQCDFKRRSQRSPESYLHEEPRLKGRRFVRPRMDGQAEDVKS